MSEAKHIMSGLGLSVNSDEDVAASDTTTSGLEFGIAFILFAIDVVSCDRTIG